MASDNTYERVTNPDRFATLHPRVHELAAELQRCYEFKVQLAEPEPAHLRHGVLSALLLSPANDGAPITITLTGFPGLSVRFGARHVEAFLHCGCDACDEQPPHLADNLRRTLTSVADGRFRETGHGYEFIFDDGREGGTDHGSPVADEMTCMAWLRRAASQHDTAERVPRLQKV